MWYKINGFRLTIGFGEGDENSSRISAVMAGIFLIIIGTLLWTVSAIPTMVILAGAAITIIALAFS